MKKKISFKIKFILLFIIVLLLSLNIQKTNALVSGNFEELSPTGDSYPYKVCKLEGGDTVSKYKIRTNIGPGNKYKYGYFYEYKIGGQIAFCMTAGKRAGKAATYTRGDKVDRVKDKKIYQIYQAYLDGTYDLKKAQLMMWYYTSEQPIIIHSTYGMEVDITDYFGDFTNMYVDYYKSLACYNYEGAIKIYLNKNRPAGEPSTSFTCDAYMTSGADDKKWIYNDLGQLDYWGFNDYLNLISELKQNPGYNNGTSYGNYDNTLLQMAIADYTQYKSLTKMYSGDLYWWEPDLSGYQIFVGVAGCNNKVESCESDLSELLKKFPTENDRKLTNASYALEVEKMKNKYSKFVIDENDQPSCQKGPDIVIEPKCDPNYADVACDYSHDIGGISMSDQGSASEATACYFSKNIGYTTESNQNISSIDKNLSNQFCTVKCWESFKANFPTALSNIPAGSTFFWGLFKGNGNFGDVTVMRYCSTIDINYGSFNTQFTTNEATILKAYNDYKAQEIYQSNQPVSDGECNISCTTKNVSCTAGTTGCTCDDEGKNCTKSETNCIKGTTYKKDKVTYGSNGESTSGSVCKKTAAEAQSDLNGSHLSSRKTTLQNAINTRKSLLFQIRSCESTSYINNNNDGTNKDGTIYHFDTKVKLNYTDPLGTNRNITNPIALEQKRKSTSLENGGQIDAANPILSVSCTQTSGVSGIGNYDGCNSATVYIDRYNEYHWRFDGTYYYDYPKSDFFWYALKESSYVKNEKSYTAGAIAPYVIGYGIPTGFALKTGFYDISVDVEGFGNKSTQWDKNGNAIAGVNYHFEPLVKEKLSTSVYNYACPYHVVNKLYGNECEWDCDFNSKTCTLRSGSPDYCNGGVKGIDLVYRVIELNKDEKIVFPGLIGTGRKQGENWATFIQNKRNWFTNIMNYDLIYDDEPIYSIDLTPSLIQEIRADNRTYRQARKDPYTSFTNASNSIKVHCEGETINQTCASDWISDLIGRGLLTGQYCTSSNTAERLESIKNLKNQYDGAVR